MELHRHRRRRNSNGMIRDGFHLPPDSRQYVQLESWVESWVLENLNSGDPDVENLNSFHQDSPWWLWKGVSPWTRREVRQKLFIVSEVGYGRWDGRLMGVYFHWSTQKLRRQLPIDSNWFRAESADFLEHSNEPFATESTATTRITINPSRLKYCGGEGHRHSAITVSLARSRSWGISNDAQGQIRSSRPYAYEHFHHHKAHNFRALVRLDGWLHPLPTLYCVFRASLP